MDNRIEAFQVAAREITEILADFRNRRRLSRELAPREQVAVETDDLVSGSLQNRTGDGADIAFMPGEQNLHAAPILERICIRRSSAPFLRTNPGEGVLQGRLLS